MSLIHTWIHRAPAERPALILADGKTLRFSDLIIPPKPDGLYPLGTLNILEGSATSLAYGLINAALGGQSVFPLPPGLHPEQRAALLVHARAAASPNLALIILSSASSGKAKGVRLSWRAIAAASRMSARVTHLQPGDAWLACLPLFHIGGAMVVYRCLRAGATAVVHDGFDVNAVARDLTARHITHLSLVPPMLAQLLEAGVSPPPTLRCVLVGGAALHETLLARARTAGWPVHTSWGMSETCATITLDGKPLPGVRVRVSHAGRLEVSTPARMAGYLGAPEAEDWLTTDDLGIVDTTGGVRILGRADEMLVSAGLKVHPLDIEAQLAACPGLREACVIGLADPIWGQIVACAYAGEITDALLSDWCRAHLPSSHRPRRFMRMKALPHLTSGKLDRRALPELWRHLQPSVASQPDWGAATEALRNLTNKSPRVRLLSVTLPLTRWPTSTHLSPTDGVFWQRPEAGQRMLGAGRACHISSTGPGRFTALQAALRGLMDAWQRHDHPSAPPPLAFTGFAYAPQGGAPLPNAALWVPELLLREQEDHVWLTLTCAAAEAEHALARWQKQWLALQTLPEATNGPPPVHAPNPLADALFRARGRAALDAIGTGLVDKLVLTRSLRLDSRAAIQADGILATLAAQQPNCAIYGAAYDSRVFIGASPETLLTRQGDQVSVDALAGTTWREAELTLSDDKNRREHDFVANAVANALAPLCHRIHIPAVPEVMRLHGTNPLSHLRRRITARASTSTSAFDLIARLHPTSAVGGVPREAAIDWLARQGDVRSAWYTGGIGWIDANGDCDIAVALRCGLIEKQSITLQAGAGFVSGSIVEQEFAETEAKFNTLREATTAACKTPEAA